MKLENNLLSVQFDQNLNAFTELYNLGSGDNYVKTVPAGPFIEVYVLADGEKRCLKPGKAEVTEICHSSGNLHYCDFDGIEITMDVGLEVVGTMVNISAELKNNSGYDVVEVLMPRLSGIYLGQKYQDDYIIYPHHAGERTQNPVLRYGKEKQDVWRASSKKFGEIYRREINYCGLASMSWMYYYDAENGLYIGSHDDRFPVTGIIADTSGDSQNPWMGFSFRKFQRVRPGEQRNIGTYVVAISSNDWHYGAQIYRRYIEHALDFNHTPDFLRKEYALNQCYNFKRNGEVEHPFSDIPEMYETGAQWGVHHLFMAGWNRGGFDTDYPEYYPDMELGTAMELNRGLTYIREHGGFSTMYINARIFDIYSQYHKTLGEKMGIRNECGELYHEQYGPAKFTVNCPSDKLWQNYLLDTAEFAMKAYGCDGIYLDQLASAEPFACYAEHHSHSDIGEFNNGYISILAEMLARLRRYNPNAYIMTENCGDIYGSYTWGNLTWNGAHYDEYYQVFKYTFPEFVQVNMVNSRKWVPEEERADWYYRDIHRAIALNNVMWFGLTNRMGPADGFYHQYAKKALVFRKELADILDGAQFLDNLWFNGEIPEKCQATCWLQKSGDKVVIAANDTDCSFASTVVLPDDVHSAEYKCIEDQNVDMHIDNKHITFVLQPHQMVRIVVK